MNQPQTFHFFGKPGAGKGTQAKLLVEYLKGQGHTVVYIETGGKFRSLKESGTYMSQLIQNCMNSGGLLPEFIPVWAWTDMFMQNFTGSESLVLDGVARRPMESELLDAAFDFMHIDARNIIFVNVSAEWSVERLMDRGKSAAGRKDDTEEAIRLRLKSYDQLYAPSMEFFRTNDKYNFIEINGEQSIEAVHEEIKKALQLL